MEIRANLGCKMLGVDGNVVDMMKTKELYLELSINDSKDHKFRQLFVINRSEAELLLQDLTTALNHPCLKQNGFIIGNG
jgi:hypothetical protein